MANRIDKAASWLGNPRAEKNAGKQSMALTTGTATSDSENGFVNVIVGDTTITENNDGQSVIIPTSVKVLEGDTVIITANGNDTIKTPIVSDVIGGGDRIYVDMSSVAEAAAEQAAAQVEQVANEAKEAAEATNQHFYADDNGVHVITTSEAVGPNILVNSNGVLLRDGYNTLSSQTRSGFSVYEYGNTEPSATFGTTTVIGQASEGSEMCIRDRKRAHRTAQHLGKTQERTRSLFCIEPRILRASASSSRWRHRTYEDRQLYRFLFRKRRYFRKSQGSFEGDGNRGERSNHGQLHLHLVRIKNQ